MVLAITVGLLISSTVKLYAYNDMVVFIIKPISHSCISNYN